ncbi:glycoside hydrolase family 31 protein [Spirosoma taeanense]|uniref:glycoside hydrolase family 31 protein n=1 Tax=Spirosoma taeanense TaxID=2735870 RepID=UPI001F033447|nr:TIM-barrel domain-containing protein [Spirosoma taeanense]
MRTLILFLFSFQLVRAQALVWTPVQPGVWKAVVGKPEAYNLLTAAGAKPSTSALAKLGPTPFPLPQPAITARLVDGKTYLRFPLNRTEQLYGFGLNFQTVHQRGRILNLHVDHYGGSDNGRTHAPTPFYVSSDGYGVFINSARYLTVYAGTAARKDSPDPPKSRDRNTDKAWTSRPYSDAVEILVPAAGVEIYVFGGPKPLDVVRRYNLFNGGGCLPPRWGLGFVQRVQKLYNAEQVEAEAAQFEQQGFPLDVVGLEPGWQSKSYPCTFEWDKTRFPDPAGFVGNLLRKGIRTNLWINPYVAPSASIFKSIQPYTASHTVWTGQVPDLSLPQAQTILFGQLAKDGVNLGVSGYKIDEVDGYDSWLWPDVATFPSGHAAEQMRQTYGLLVQRYSTDLYRSRNSRTFGLVRASNAGGTSFPYVIYNDYYKHQDFITALINSSFAGVLWTPEVRSSETSEEWLRRIQTVVFSPMAMINAWDSGTKPWSFADVSKPVQDMALLRMQMMPYWYSEFARYHFDGTPPFRAMNLEEGFTSEVKNELVTTSLEKNPYAEAVRKEIKDQYMAGEFLLVAPLFAGQTRRTVTLPKGNWYDFYTGELVGNGQQITASPGLNRIPVYVKDGGIIPMMPSRLHAPKAGETVPVEVRYYGNKPGVYQLYDDDGETFAYENGQYSFRAIRVTRQANGSIQGTISAPVPGKPNTVGAVTFTQMTK